MQRHDHRAARRGKRGEMPEQGELVRGIEAGGRLVGEQHARLLRQRAGNQHAGPLAARHLEHRPLGEMGDIHGGSAAAMARASAALSPAPIGWYGRRPSATTARAVSAQCTMRSCGR